MTTKQIQATFARFFRAVEGRIMSRYGTAATTVNGYRAATVFGGRRPAGRGNPVDAQVRPIGSSPMPPMIIDTEAVTPITHAEAMKYRREYDRAVRVGDLVECTEEDYLTWVLVSNERGKVAKAKAESLRARRREAAGLDQKNGPGRHAADDPGKSRKRRSRPDRSNDQ